MGKMAETKRPKATLLQPGDEYNDYEKFCKKEDLEVVSEATFYKGAYFLAVRGLVSGFEKDGVAAYEFGETTLLLCEVADKGLALSLFKASDLEEMAKQEPAIGVASITNLPPADHIE